MRSSPTARASTSDQPRRRPRRNTVGDVSRDGPLLSTRIAYEVGERRWVHHFTTRRLDDDEISGVLAAAGFLAPDWLTSDHAWAAARRG